MIISVLPSKFRVALDRTILATVWTCTRIRPSLQPSASYFETIPRITDEFHSIRSVGWYGSAYMLTCCALQLINGKIYTLFSVKWTLLRSILVFEASSALSGAGHHSTALIVGHIWGVGAADFILGSVYAARDIELSILRSSVCWRQVVGERCHQLGEWLQLTPRFKWRWGLV